MDRLRGRLGTTRPIPPSSGQRWRVFRPTAPQRPAALRIWHYQKIAVNFFLLRKKEFPQRVALYNNQLHIQMRLALLAASLISIGNAKNTKPHIIFALGEYTFSFYGLHFSISYALCSGRLRVCRRIVDRGRPANGHPVLE
jgi:hypothetical protein